MAEGAPGRHDASLTGEARGELTEPDEAFDSAWERERVRLAALESIFDEVTQRVLARLGVTDGWRCLEIGAGAGSVASWLCEHVGSGGRVTATDIDTRFLERLSHPSLEVRRHDIACDPLEERSYDLIHARMVLEHVPERDEVVARLVAALRPGGWLVVEDVDLTPALYVPAEAWLAIPERNRDPILQVNRSLHEALASLGADMSYGRRLPEVLTASGLADVDAELTARLVTGRTARSEYSRLSIELLRGALETLVPPEVIERALECHRDPRAAWMSIPLVSAWGRRPADQLRPMVP